MLKTSPTLPNNTTKQFSPNYLPKPHLSHPTPSTVIPPPPNNPTTKFNPYHPRASHPGNVCFSKPAFPCEKCGTGHTECVVYHVDEKILQQKACSFTPRVKADEKYDHVASKVGNYEVATSSSQLTAARVGCLRMPTCYEQPRARHVCSTLLNSNTFTSQLGRFLHNNYPVSGLVALQRRKRSNLAAPQQQLQQQALGTNEINQTLQTHSTVLDAPTQISSQVNSDGAPRAAVHKRGTLDRQGASDINHSHHNHQNHPHQNHPSISTPGYDNIARNNTQTVYTNRQQHHPSHNHPPTSPPVSDFQTTTNTQSRYRDGQKQPMIPQAPSINIDMRQFTTLEELNDVIQTHGRLLNGQKAVHAYQALSKIDFRATQERYQTTGNRQTHATINQRLSPERAALRKQTIDFLEELIGVYAHNLHHKDVSTAVLSMSKLKSGNTELLRRLLAFYVDKNAMHGTPQSIANVVFACGSMKYNEPVVLDKCIGFFTNLMVKAAKEGSRNASPLQDQDTRMRQTLHPSSHQQPQLRQGSQVQQQQSANIPAPVPQSQQQLHLSQDTNDRNNRLRQPLQIKPLDLVNMVYGLGVLNYCDSTFIAQVSHFIQQGPIHASEFNAHMISNMIYGLGHMLVLDYPLLDYLHTAAQHAGYDTFTPQGISNSLYGLGLMRAPKGHPLVQQLAEQLVQPRILKSALEQHVANSMYGLGLLQYSPEAPFLAALTDELRVPGRVRSFKDHGLVSITFAMAQLRMCAPDVFHSLCVEYIRRYASKDEGGRKGGSGENKLELSASPSMMALLRSSSVLGLQVDQLLQYYEGNFSEVMQRGRLSAQMGVNLGSSLAMLGLLRTQDLYPLGEMLRGQVEEEIRSSKDTRWFKQGQHSNTNNNINNHNTYNNNNTTSINNIINNNNNNYNSNSSSSSSGNHNIPVKPQKEQLLPHGEATRSVAPASTSLPNYGEEAVGKLGGNQLEGAFSPHVAPHPTPPYMSLQELSMFVGRPDDLDVGLKDHDRDSTLMLGKGQGQRVAQEQQHVSNLTWHNPNGSGAHPASVPSEADQGGMSSNLSYQGSQVEADGQASSGCRNVVSSSSTDGGEGAINSSTQYSSGAAYDWTKVAPQTQALCSMLLQAYSLTVIASPQLPPASLVMPPASVAMLDDVATFETEPQTSYFQYNVSAELGNLGVEHVCEASLEGGGVLVDMLVTPRGVAQLNKLYMQQMGVKQQDGGLGRGQGGMVVASEQLHCGHVGQKETHGMSVQQQQQQQQQQQWLGGGVGLLNGQGLVLEVDGPVHYAGDNVNMAMGPTLFRNTLLTALGWKVCIVPWYEWNEVKDDKAARSNYLFRKLVAALRQA